MSSVWFTSDTHYNHQNMVEFRNEVHGQGRRLFGDVVDVNMKLVENCCKVISKRDSVWHLGDVNFYKWGSAKSYLDMLPNAHWKLVLGNHDVHPAQDYLQFFKRIFGAHKKYGFMMTHIPCHQQEMGYTRCAYNVHGHIHHKERDIKEDNYFNVNVDVNNLMPVHLDTILAQFGLPHGG